MQTEKLCTLIIPTYNRPHYLKRILSFYSNNESKFKIIIGDSSETEKKQENKKIIEKFSELKIEYNDEYTTKIISHHKFADLVTQVKTKYLVFCAEDDFVLPSGINEAIKFLEKNKDFLLAQGVFINFYLDKKKPVFGAGYNYDSITMHNPEDRAFFHLSNYAVPTAYAVFKTKDIREIYKEMIKSKINPVFFGELFPSVMALMYGKLKKLDMLYGVRNVELSKTGKNWPDLLESLKTKKCTIEEKDNFVKALSINLQKKSNLTYKKSEKTIEFALNNYLKRIKKRNDSLIGKIKKMLINSKIPDSVNIKIRKIYRRLVKKNKLSNKIKSDKELTKVKICILNNL